MVKNMKKYEKYEKNREKMCKTFACHCIQKMCIHNDENVL